MYISREDLYCSFHPFNKEKHHFLIFLHKTAKTFYLIPFWILNMTSVLGHDSTVDLWQYSFASIIFLSKYSQSLFLLFFYHQFLFVCLH